MWSSSDPRWDNLKRRYTELFAADQGFQEVYKSQRITHYTAVVEILCGLGVEWVLDVGCAFGLLVEMLNKRGIEAYGIDLPIDALIRHHNSLRSSRNRFIFGDVNAPDFWRKIPIRVPRSKSAVILLDTLRYTDAAESIRELSAEFILVKEVSDNFLMRWLRRGEFDVRLYTPLACAGLFSGYRPYAAYAPRFFFKFPQPGWLSLALLSFFPTYSVLLKRRQEPGVLRFR